MGRQLHLDSTSRNFMLQPSRRWCLCLAFACVFSGAGCHTFGRGQSPCLVLNEGAAYSQSNSLFTQRTPTVQSDLANPSVVRGRSKVVPMPLPGENESTAKVDEDVIGSGYRPEETSLIREQEESLKGLPTEGVPGKNSGNTARPAGPDLGASPIGADVQLDVTAVPEAQVNGEVSFKIRLTNTGGEAARDVVLQCDFDEGLAFPGREERGIIQRLGELAAGETKEVELSLLAKTEGERSALFTARASNVTAITPVTQRLSIVPQALFLELNGPGQGRVGEKLTYRLTVRNASATTLSNVEIHLKADRELRPRLAEGNTGKEENGWVWQIPQLEGGVAREFQIDLEGLSIIDAANLVIEGKADGVPGDTLKATIEIQERLAPPVTRVVPPDVHLGTPESL